MVDFRMPSLGADMEAGTLVEWRVKPGDTVRRGDIVAVVETQKGAIEIEIFDKGEVEEILVEVGSKVPVATTLARIRTEGETAPVAGSGREPIGSAQPASQITSAIPQVPPGRDQPKERAGAARFLASPAARRLARSSGVDLATVTGRGPMGAVTSWDVERHVSAAGGPEPKTRPTGLDLDAMRVAIAAAMARSKREIPHYYLQHRIDVGRSTTWLSAMNAQRPPERRILMSALFVKATALAARRYPLFNGFCRDRVFEPSASINVGVAIAIRGGGLAAPAILETDRMPLDDVMERMRDLIQRMRAGRIRSSEIADPTITVSILGERGVEALYGVIYPPQVAIVGFGKVIERPWIAQGAVAARPVVVATLAADHRVSDGHAGGLFLAEIEKRLSEPEML